MIQQRSEDIKLHIFVKADELSGLGIKILEKYSHDPQGVEFEINEAQVKHSLNKTLQAESPIPNGCPKGKRMP